MNFRKAMISLLAAGAVAITAVAPASAVMRVAVPSVKEAVQLAPIQVQGREYRRDQNSVIYRKGNRYWNGHRGYRNYRNGYQRYNDGFWYPRAAFGLSIIIAPQPRRIIRSYGGNGHVNWCYNRYRSYRAYDNSYQPYGGPRRICYSPYN